MSRTGTLATLFANAPEPAVELNPSDLARRGLAAGDLVRVESRRGNVVIPVAAAQSSKPGAAFISMHWGSAVLAGRASTGINAVTAKAYCPSSKQPELKHAAVRIAKVDLPWKLVAFGFPENNAELIALRNDVRARASALDYASVVLIGGERAGVFLRAACALPVDAVWLAELDRVFGLADADAARYDDPKRAIGRRVRVVAGRLAAVRLSGDVAAEAWLRDWLVAGEDVARIRSQLLVPTATAPSGYRSRGRIVCNCHDVAELDIMAKMAECAGPGEAMLAQLKDALRCGTNCGSCVPELRQMIAASVAAMAA
jgi:assimilatory nitrate reductase catalytic subunit